jgi:hypothetical protein
MAFPIRADSQTFTPDQRVLFNVHYWDTTTTAVRVGPSVGASDRLEAFGTGVEYALFDVMASAFALSPSNPEAALNNVGMSRSVLGYDELGDYRTGVVPNIYAYWGAGAPPGGARAKQVLQKFSGYIQETTANVSLVFAGQGNIVVRVRHTNDTYTVLASGPLREPNPTADTSVVSPNIIRNDWGYQFTEARSFLVGEYIEIYHWHNGESWGGIAAKVVPGALATTSDTFLTQVREAPVLGTSFMAKEAAPLAAQPVRDVLGADIKQDVGSIAEMTLRVGLALDNEETGYHWDPDANRLVHNTHTGEFIAVGRAIHLEGGFSHGAEDHELYSRFTGFVDEVFPAADGSHAIVQCRGFDGKLEQTFDENVPDRLDYHAAGFILREPSSEPVFGIPAADHWPIETLLMAFAARSGVDHYNLGLRPTKANTTHGLFRFADTATGNEVFGGRLFSARPLGQKPLQLERNANYGNVPPLTKDFLPPDDEYLYPPEVTGRLYDRARAVVELFGYDLFFNADGQWVLTGRNNATAFQYATVPGAYSASADDTHQQVNVGAVGGVYHGVKHSVQPVWSRVIQGHFARLDLYAGVGINEDGVNGGRFSVLIERDNGAGGWTTMSTTIYSTASSADESFYYDGLLKADGTNAALFRILALPFDHYRVTIAAAGVDTSILPLPTDCWYRINGVAVYERNVEQNAFVVDGAEKEFSTLDNSLSVAPFSNAKDLRNHVVVVGSRRAVITDSAKLAEEGQTEGNNPEREFYVAVAVDPFSIYDPTSDNFVGMKRMAVVFDDRVADTGHARWLTRAILAQYRNPPTSAQINHTIVPMLELRDPIYAVEEAHQGVRHLVWVTSFAEKWAPADATVTIDTFAYPQIPSYEPREDVDIDTLFIDPADGKGEPAINVEISYKNIYGRRIGNATTSQDAAIRAFATRAPGAGRFTPMRSENIVSGVSHTASYPAIPETMFLGWGSTEAGNALRDINAKGYSRFRRRALVNGPYRHFYNLSWNPTTKIPTLTFDFQEGDGTAGVYDQAYYGFPSPNAWQLHYDYLTARTISATPAENPWYDPYTSELGNLVDVSFNLLVSGRVRASVWAYSDALGMEIPIAWLTSPAGDPETPDAHWEFMEAGAKSFSFDGVDTIGLWNTLQSQEYAESMKGAFGEKPMAVGRGFYAWNDRTTNLHTAIGDDNSWDNLDGRGLRKPNYDAEGRPYYTIGQFTQMYIKIEVANDALLRRDFSNGRTAPRLVDSRALPTALAMNTHSRAFLWQHLGEPTQVAIRMQDWANVSGDTLTEAWVPGAATDPSDWTDFSAPDANASLRIGKPVRITFQPRPHRGPMWEDAAGDLDASTISARLTRAVHHKGTVFDQFWHLTGSAWDGFHKDWQGNASGVEKKRLQNRMFHNEDHTIEFEDSAWRSGASFASYEWIFDPTRFEKDFGAGIRERLRYADYEQLEQLPGFDSQQLGGTAAGARAYMMMAYMAHMFYFSAFVMDRSGRRQHCINSWVDENGEKRGWIDKSKIVTPAWKAATDNPAAGTYRPQYILDYETRGAERYLPRTVFVRQWREPAWATGSFPGSPVARYNIESAHQLAFVQCLTTAFGLYQSPHPMVDAAGEPDWWLSEYQRKGSVINRLLRFRSAQLGTSTLATIDPLPGIINFIPTSFGTWDWDRPGLVDYFRPNPARDFHPYARFPVTPDTAIINVNAYLGAGSDMEDLAALSALEAPTSSIAHDKRDYSGQEQWYGYAFAHHFAHNYYETHPLATITSRTRYFGARLEQTVEEFGANGPNSRLDTNAMTRAKIEALFDYAKMDNLDRWDQFRGLRARAPYGDRNDWGGGAHPVKRRASVQPVRPSGVYLFSTGRVTEIALAPVGPAMVVRCHWTSQAHSFWHLQFWHEYAWYSARYFPVSRLGGAAYMFLRDEYTGVSGYIGFPWVGGPASEAVEPTKALYFDSGAWTGWRPDLVSGTTLKWKEADPVSEARLVTNALVTLQGDASSTTYITTPYNAPHTYSGSLNYIRTNILDEYFSKATGPRLAVAPVLPEARTLVVNLTLPERLRGDL